MFFKEIYALNICHQCCVCLFFCTIQQISSSDMESKTDVGSASLTSEELAAVEDEEVLNKLVSQ